MQVTETLSEGLKREYKVVVPAAELDAKVNARLDELKDRVRINGFRPGKVPVTHLKRMYGRSAMAEVIEATVRDTNNQIVTEHGYKLALPLDGKSRIERVRICSDPEALGRCIPPGRARPERVGQVSTGADSIDLRGSKSWNRGESDLCFGAPASSRAFARRAWDAEWEGCTCLPGTRTSRVTCKAPCKTALLKVPIGGRSSPAA